MPRALLPSFLAAATLAGGAACQSDVVVPPAPPATSTSAAAVTASSPLRASIRTVTDTRTTGTGPSAGCLLDIIFTGDLAYRAKSVAAVRLTEAADDTGGRLSASSASFGPPLGFLSSVTQSSVLSASLRLQGVSRRAQALRYVEGEVDLNLPAEGKGSVTIPALLQQVGKTIDHPDLKRCAVKFAYLDRDAYANLRLSTAMPAPTDFVNQAVFSVEDTGKKLASFSLVDGRGRPITMTRRTSSTSNGVSVIVYALNAPLPDDAQVVFDLVLPEALQTYKFRIDNIALP